MNPSTYIVERFTVTPPSNGGWGAFVAGVWDAMKGMAESRNPFVAAAFVLAFPVIVAVLSRLAGAEGPFVWLSAGLAGVLGGWLGWRYGSALMLAGFVLFVVGVAAAVVGGVVLLVLAIAG